MTVERTSPGLLPWTTKVDLRSPEASPGSVNGPNTAGERPRVLFGSAVPNSPSDFDYEFAKNLHPAAAATPAIFFKFAKYALFKDDFERTLHATFNNNFHSTRKELLKREGLSTIIAVAGSAGDSRDRFVEVTTRHAEDVASGDFLSDADPTNNGISVVGRSTAGPGGSFVVSCGTQHSQ